MKSYIHELDDWPQFTWDASAFIGPLAEARHRQDNLLGKTKLLGFEMLKDAVLQALTDEVHASSAIECEKLDRDQVYSSVARHLGIKIEAAAPEDRRVEGMVEMVLDATQRYDEPLTAKRLWGWHAALFPAGYSGIERITVGAWREGPMQVVSSRDPHRVYYEAPDAPRLGDEMSAFLNWFDAPVGMNALVKAALAHLWFVSVHPFDDGNGRIARAISDMGLARSEGTATRFYSMSGQILDKRDNYYNVLERVQKGDLEITEWIVWYMGCFTRTIERSETELKAAQEKARFWRALQDATLNERQRKVLNRLLVGFEGKLTVQKWSRITKCSHDTALRDIQALIDLGVLMSDGVGRSTNYTLTDMNQLKYEQMRGNTAAPQP